jgi:hypothetical protein
MGYLNEEVNCTEPSPSVSSPCWTSKIECAIHFKMSTFLFSPDQKKNLQQNGFIFFDAISSQRSLIFFVIIANFKIPLRETRRAGFTCVFHWCHNSQPNDTMNINTQQWCQLAKLLNYCSGEWRNLDHYSECFIA